MPHQCVKCGTFYSKGSQEILNGCPCGSKLFFFVRKTKEGILASQRQQPLTDDEKAAIEDDVGDLVGRELGNDPVVLDLEAIRVRKPGQYDLDLVHLFKEEGGVVYKLEEGKYVVDLSETFRRFEKK